MGKGFDGFEMGWDDVADAVRPPWADDREPRSTIEFDSLVLDRIPLAVGTRITRQVLHDVSLDMQVRVFEDALEHLAIELRALVLAEKVGEKDIKVPWRGTVHVPASWWQHLKLSLPDWFQRRWPAKYVSQFVSGTKIVSVIGYETFPDAVIRTPENIHRGLLVPYTRVGVSDG